MKPAISRILLFTLCLSAMIPFAFSPQPLPAASASGVDNAHLYLSMESVLAMLKRNQDIILVDVRHKEAFDKSRIAGSIHLPLHALKTKDFLKTKPSVLVAEGFPNRELENTCTSLREAGFERAFILRGGLKGWQEQNGPMEGDVFSRQELNQVSPRSFYLEKDSMDWLVIHISDPGPEPVIDRAVPVPYKGDREAFLRELRAALENNPGPVSRSLLIVDEKGEHYSAIEPAIRRAKIRRVFYLAGGVEGYKVFLNHLEASRYSTIVGVTRCAGCP